MSMGNEKGFLEEVKTSESQKSKLLREGFAQKNVGQYLDGPRRTRRSKLLPSGKSMKGKCNHCISENYLSSSSCGPKVRDNYCCYTCMLCYKQIKFLGKTSNQTTTHNLQPNE